MWMIGYNDGVELNLQDSFNGRKLRPLVPRPSTTAANASSSSFSPNHSCLGRRIHATDLLAFNHHLGTVTEQGKREYNSQQVLVSSRWNPTPEQLLTLEELYRRGTRTPSADQIQQITAQLRRYGKIEGKNVFYWFQNHKARERQKRRRQLDDAPDDEHQYPDLEVTGRKEPGTYRTGIEVEQMINKSWALTTSCTSTLADQRSATLQMRAAKAAEASGGAERRAGGCWVQQFHEREDTSHERRKNATWQKMQHSSSHPQNHHINPSTTTTTTTTPFSTNTTAVTVRKMDPNLIISHTQELLQPYREYIGFNGHGCIDEEGNGTSQTLELFPLRSGNNSDNEDGATFLEEEEEEEKDNFTCNHQYFEFLPLKN